MSKRHGGSAVDRLLRRLVGLDDEPVVAALMRIADGQDCLREDLADFRRSFEAAIERITKMGQNYQQAMAAITAEVEGERNLFIGAVKLLQANADQVKQAADALEDGPVSDQLTALAAQMRENAGPLAAALVANTPAATPPMASSPAVSTGQGDGTSALLPGDATGPVAGPATTGTPQEGDTRNDPATGAPQRYTNGSWVNE